MSWEEPQFAGDVSAKAISPRTEKPKRAKTSGDAMLDPIAFLGFLYRNLWKILLSTLLLSAILFTLFLIFPFPYKSTALVLVDPRENKVTPGDAVVSSIGGDAAVLESVIQIILSDGFLRPVVKSLNVAEDPEFNVLVDGLQVRDERRDLSTFRKNLEVFRRGATFVVEISYTSQDPERAARYANAVAQAFLDNESSTRSSAATNAAESLSGRLGALRASLQKSEEAVATFRSENGIFDVGQDNTLQQRELSELSEQIAAAKANTEGLRAQYQQLRNTDIESFSTFGDETEAANLQSLRQTQSQLRQNQSELNLTFGPQHPRVVAGQSRLDTLNQQIEQERARLIQLYEKRLAAAVASQQALVQELARLTSQASRTEGALVKLADLERQANADREIYNEFLSRLKTTEEQKTIKSTEAKLVSPASPPLLSTRPAKPLAAGVIGVFSMMVSVMIFFLLEAFRKPDELTEGSSPSPVLRKKNKNFALNAGPYAPDRSAGGAERWQNSEKRTLTQRETVRILLPYLSNVKKSGIKPMARALASKLSQGPDILEGGPRDREGQVLLVTSLQEGEGKTSLCHALAHISKRHKNRPLVLTSYENASRALRLRINHKEEDFGYPVVNPLSDALRDWAADFTVGAALSRLVEDCRGSHGPVFIDADSVERERHMHILAKLCDQVVIVADPNRSEPDELRRTLRLFREWDRPVEIVANRV